MQHESDQHKMEHNMDLNMINMMGMRDETLTNRKATGILHSQHYHAVHAIFSSIMVS